MTRDRYESLEYDGRLYDKIRSIESKNEHLQKELKEKDKEIERLTELCNKYEEEHKTTFEIWQKDIKENEHLRTALNSKESIIKEVREYIEENTTSYYTNTDETIEGYELVCEPSELLEILDKGE